MVMESQGSVGAAELERGDDDVDPPPHPAIANTNVIARAILGACTNSSSSRGTSGAGDRSVQLFLSDQTQSSHGMIGCPLRTPFVVTLDRTRVKVDAVAHRETVCAVRNRSEWFERGSRDFGQGPVE